MYENIKTSMSDKYFEDRRNYHKLYRKQERAHWSKQKQNPTISGRKTQKNSGIS